MQVILGSRGQDEVDRPRMRHLGCGRHALHGLREIVDRRVFESGVILDRAPRESGVERQRHRVGNTRRIGCVAILEVGRHRELGRPDDRRTVRDHLVAGDASIEAPEAGGEAAAGRRESSESKRPEKPGGAGIPWIGQQERRAGDVKCEQASGSVGLAGDSAGLLVCVAVRSRRQTLATTAGGVEHRRGVPFADPSGHYRKPAYPPRSGHSR